MSGPDGVNISSFRAMVAISIQSQGSHNHNLQEVLLNEVNSEEVDFSGSDNEQLGPAEEGAPPRQPGRCHPLCERCAVGSALGGLGGVTFGCVMQNFLSGWVLTTSSFGCGTFIYLTVAFSDKIMRCFERCYYRCRGQQNNPDPGPEGIP
jgi:hypothetical protein